jgi:periplasmic divalent cation tolerance protein
LTVFSGFGPHLHPCFFAASQFSFLTPVKTAAHSIVLVTAPDLKIARQLAALALEAKLVACVNLLPGIESHYWWQGKLDHGTEILLVLKTVKKNLRALEKLILANHPYDTPEFISFPITDGTKRYLSWITESCRSK